MFSLGVVVIYRASRVLNLAHGAMAMVPAYVAFSLTNSGVPATISLALGTASGALVGLAVERVFVRGLHRQGPTGQTVGTVAALGLILAMAVKTWGTTPRTGVGVFPEGGIRVGSSLLQWGQIGLVATAIAAAAALFALFQRTDLGLSMRAAADNRQAAALMGIDPDWTTRLAWALAGALAGLAGILLAAVTTLHPVTLSLLVLPAFVAALIGGLDSLTGAVIGASVVGLAQGMVPALGLIPGIRPLATQIGAPQFVLAVVAFIVMSLRGDRLIGSDPRAGSAVRPQSAARATRLSVTSAHQKERRWHRPAAIAVAVLLLTWPLIASFSLLGSSIRALVVLLVAASLVLLTGWVGQISLAQASFVGVAAFVTPLLARGLHVPFPFNLPIAALISATAAALLGIVALRVRGLYLAVATLIFAWMADEFLFRSAWLVGTGGGSSLTVDPIGRDGSVPHFDFSDRRAFYYVALAVAATALWTLANLRDSRTGRAFFAVRGSEIAAASLGIDVTRYKLLAFSVSGFLAGAAGNLLIVGQGTAVPAQFTIGVSLFYLAVVVVGGVRSLGGAVGAAILFAGLEETFFRVRVLAGWLQIVSAVLLAAVLIVYPGGLAGLPESFARLSRRIAKTFMPERTADSAGADMDEPSAASPSANGDRELSGRSTSLRLPVPDAKSRPDGRGGVSSRIPIRFDREVDGASKDAVLEVRSLEVRFGGLLAVDGVSLEVRLGEVVGLIGPNGAGKTTIFNAISGLNVPSEGSIRMHGVDVSSLPVHSRARLGIARTFQVIQLFPELSVFENLLVATHVQSRTGLLDHLVVSAPALLEEREARQRVRAVMTVLDLEDVANLPVSGLPFGVLRLVEFARTLVTGAPLIMLDEPASGLDNQETDRLGELLLTVRDELDLSILLIEHDVRLVMTVSDHVYVVNRGQIIAEGTPAEVQRNEQVIAAYLGAAPTAAVG